MTDSELARALERGEIANTDFHHASHLHVAWAYLSESASIEGAVVKMRQTLRQIATAAGKPEKYHETMTTFWVRLLGCARRPARPGDLEQLVHEHPQLLEKNFPLTYYSRERLFSHKARTSWIEPDLKPLVFDAVTSRSPSSSGHAPNRSLS